MAGSDGRSNMITCLSPRQRGQVRGAGAMSLASPPQRKSTSREPHFTPESVERCRERGFGIGPEEGLSVGGFVLFIQYNQQIYMPLSFLGTMWRFIRESMVDVEQILNLLHVDEKIKETPNPIPCKIEKGRIEFKNVKFTYDIKLPEEEQTTVIENLSFTVEPGTSVGIVGQTGSGKSTIMRLLYRFYDITGGQILIDGMTSWKTNI